MTFTEQEKQRVEDRVELVAERLDDELYKEYQEKTQMVRAYAEHLISGATPFGVFTYAGKFTGLRHEHSHELDAARRQALGLVPNPFGPARSHGYRLFDYMIEKGEAFTTAAQIVADVPESSMGYGGYQVESRLNTPFLRAAGWIVEKGKVKGKVAYRLVKEEGEQHGAVAG